MPNNFKFNEFNKLIPKFSGKRENLFEFIYFCDLFYTRLYKNNKMNKITFIKQISNKLTGSSLKLYNVRPWENWFQFKHALFRLYLPYNHRISYFRQISIVHQNQSNVLIYAEKIKDVIKEIYILFDLGYDKNEIKSTKRRVEQFALKSFIQNLNPNIRIHLKNIKLHTFIEAISEAIKIENNLEIRSTHESIIENSIFQEKCLITKNLENKENEKMQNNHEHSNKEYQENPEIDSENFNIVN